MPEAPKPVPTVDLMLETLAQLDYDNYLEQIGNPLALNYLQREYLPQNDPELKTSLTSLSPHDMDIKKISEKHIIYGTMQISLLGAHMIEEDIKPGKLTEDVLADRSRHAFFLFSSLAWLEATRRRYKGAIDSAALFRASEETFREKFGQIFEDRPLEEKIEMFNAGYHHAFETIHEDGFTVLNSNRD